MLPMAPRQSRKLRLAFVGQPWDSVVPGLEQSSIPVWISQVAPRLADSFDVKVCALRHRRQHAAACCRGVRYRRFSPAPDRCLQAALRRLRRRNGGGLPAFASTFSHLGYSMQVAAAMKAWRCDVAHVFNCTQFVPVIRALNRHTRIVLDMRCEWLTQLDRDLMARRIAMADAVVACSDYLTGRARARFPELADRFRTVFTGVALDRFSDSPAHSRTDRNGEPRVLYVGRVSPEKGVHVLLDAFEEVLRRHPRATLDIVGSTNPCPREFICALSDDPKVAALACFYDGPGYAAHLDGRAASLNLRPHVRWLGTLPYEQVGEHYRSADVVVNASFSESFGRSLIEAMAVGRAVVATRVGGSPEIVEDGKTGLMVEAGDSRAMADAICRLLAHGQLRRSMGRAGRRRAAAMFSWDSVAQRVARLYEEIHASQR